MSASGSAVAAPARGLHNYEVVAAKFDRAFAAELLTLSVPDQPDGARRSFLSSAQAPGGDAAALDHGREAGVVGEDVVDAPEAVAAPAAPGASTPGADLVAFDAQRVLALDYLRRGVHDVRHVDAGRRVAVPARARPRAAGMGLVEEELRALGRAEREERETGRAHAGRDDAVRSGLGEGPEEGVDDALGGLVVPG